MEQLLVQVVFFEAQEVVHKAVFLIEQTGEMLSSVHDQMLLNVLLQMEESLRIAKNGDGMDVVLHLNVEALLLILNQNRLFSQSVLTVKVLAILLLDPQSRVAVVAMDLQKGPEEQGLHKD